MHAAPRRDWIDDRASVIAVVVLSLLWTIATLALPELITWMRVDAAEKSLSEGPCEWAEDVLLVSCLLLWSAVVWWTRRDPRRFVLALVMFVQVAVLLGEELDWGRELGLGGLGSYRNLRRLLLSEFGIPEAVGSVLVMGVIGAFFAWPVLPLPFAQRWRDRIAPVRAEGGDPLALFALPLLWLIMARVGAPASVEFIQMAGYVVLSIVSLRVAIAARDAGAPSGAS